MTVFNGTNGDDMLPPLNRSNRGNDQFFPLLGMDVVDGGTGNDTLTIDYSIISADVFGTLDATTSFAGNISSNDSLGSVSFANIEHVKITSGSGNDTFNVSGKVLLENVSLAINAGAGYDQLGLDLTDLSGNTRFVVCGANVNSNRGIYSNFEAYFINTGKGNDTITTGDGDDAISGGDGNDFLNGGAGQDYIFGGIGNDKLVGGSGDDTLLGGTGRNVISAGDGNDTIGSLDNTSGIDAVDGGTGYDIWIGDYSSERQGLRFNWPGNGNGTLSNGTTLKNVEQVELLTGTGNDKIFIKGGLLEVYDSTATDFDAITIDYSASNNRIDGSISDGNGPTLGGAVIENSLTTSTRFGYMEKVIIASGSGDDWFNVGLGLGSSNYKNLTIDAGAGNDRLDLNFRLAVEDIRFAVTGNSALTKLGTYTNFEMFTVRTGSGNDTVITGGGNDIIDVSDGHNVVNSGAGNDNIDSSGNDTVDGGDGSDSWTGNYYENNSNFTFTWGGTGNGTLSNGTTLINIENVTLQTANGDVTVYLSGGNVQLLDFLRGDSDTLSADYSPRSSNLMVSCSGVIGSFTGTIQTEDGSESAYYTGYENVSIKTGAGNDDFSMIATAFSGPSVATFDANSGIDHLKLDTTNMSGNIVFNVSGTVATSNVGLFTNFESFIVNCGDGSDMIRTGSGDDVVSGGRGNDFLDGGAGNDILIGGDGSDTFHFSDLHFGTDRIDDFVHGAEKLSFSSNVAMLFSEFAITGNGTNQVIVTHGTDSIVLLGNTLITLTESDFLFA